MSVLINMEMPDNCGECCMPMEWCNKWIGVEDGKRSDECPLVPVPPHGPLIDAERVKQAMWSTLFAEEDRIEKLYGPNAVEQGRVQDGFGAALRAVVDAPTVIEAEEGEA